MISCLLAKFSRLYLYGHLFSVCIGEIEYFLCTLSCSKTQICKGP